ncbi:aminotransferase class III-fold pyridoxal phosphate-dependent enzyme, partial [Pontimonas sp.]|nr:aminotransferase class III-fold pyridoxal phosphate-dependent enzyme [Pontimonas sp.]
LSYARTDLNFPDGFDVEVFTQAELRATAEYARENFDREHVTPYMRRRINDSLAHLQSPQDLSRLRLTVDEPEDFEVLNGIFSYFGGNHFSLDDVSILAEQMPDLFVANQHLIRDGGATLGTGEKLWKRAKRAIPGGNMLLSKRAEMFLPVGWPSYFSRTSGCQVWDLDGNRFLDVGYMGIGTNVLGYSHPKVDEAVLRVVESGNLSTLNCPEEVELAERLVDLHPWSAMAKFTRSGGEACAVALRIARAASGKDGVAFCGYHGWHDWYLSAALASDGALDQHLLAGLETNGVPAALSGGSRPFAYNKLDELEEILREGATGVIFMEVERNFPPDPGFLAGVKRLSRKYGAVLVFDECTSGFRQVIGGLHLQYGVDPDIVIFGKTLGNGYAINAIVGTRDVMESANSTFISSTFWTERIGPAAALASLEVMSAENAPARIHSIGLEVRESWKNLARGIGLQLDVRGVPALSSFGIVGFDQNSVKTLVTKELLNHGYLSTTALYASIAHSPEIIHSYLAALGGVFEKLFDLGPDGLKAELPLGPALAGFSRLN